MHVALVTGANRGVGLALCGALAKRGGGTVLAACRTPDAAQELHELAEAAGNVVVLKLDVTQHDTFDGFAEKVKSIVGDAGVNLLVNNAGVTSKFTTLRYVKREQLMQNFETNVVGPILLTKSILACLKDASVKNSHLPMGVDRAAVINVSSVLGSIANNTDGGFYPYRCSKSALNAATRSMSVDLKKDGILAVAVHPGWLKTRMGGANAPLDADTAVARLIETLATFGEQHTGRFYQYDGEELPW